jgi:pimeloyl-ACP methyl ester carboxylesterase
VPEARVNGVSLYYEEHGTGEPIVCLHGAGSSAAVWSDAVTELAKHGRTIAYDRRGHSRSERPEPHATNVHEQADDAAALVGALGAAPAIVIGRSYGGAVAIDLALRYPDRVRALVLLEGDAPSFSEEATRWIADVTDEVLAAAEKDMSTVGQTVIEAVAGPGVWETLPVSLRELLTDNGPALVAEVRGGYPEVTVKQLATIDQPTLLVAAEESLQPGFEEVTSAMAAAMPSARVEWVEGGHLIDPAHPSVLAFVDEVLAGP